MSWLSGLLDVGKSVLGFLGGNSVGAQVVKAVTTGYALRKVTKSIENVNQAPARTPVVNTPTAPSEPVVPPIDRGVRIQASASTETKIPIVYGTAFTGGKLIDVRMTQDNQIMTYAYVISERTGVKLSDGEQSTHSFYDIYWNNQRAIFKSDGVTIDYTVDRTGVVDQSASGLVQIYCYNNGSLAHVFPRGYGGAQFAAYSVMGGWTSEHTMDGLVFAIVKVVYSKEKNITGVGNILFQVSNSMTMPGDVLYDYMSNTRYGAGIAPENILAE